MSSLHVCLLVMLMFCCDLTNAQQLYKPPEPVNVLAWLKANEPSFTYPELGDSAYAIPTLARKRHLGIAYSGGSARAAALALGWARALHVLNFTHGAGYLASNSGSTWFNAAFSFQNKDSTDDFLGPYIPPEKLSLGLLDGTVKGTSGSFGTVLAKAGVMAGGLLGTWQDIMEGGESGAAHADLAGWTNAVGEAFLEPYGLNDDVSTYTAKGTAGSIHEAAAKLPVKVYTYQDDGGARPFPLILGAVQTGVEGRAFHPFEFTPLYAGIAPVDKEAKPMIGGGFVDPLGLNTLPPTPPPQGMNPKQSSGKEPVPVTVTSQGVVPLKAVAGISSAAVAMSKWAQVKVTKQATGTETLEYWNQVDFTGGPLAFADGGAIDNTAITMLLRRKVSHIVACYASQAALVNMSAEEWAGKFPALPALFGAVPLSAGMVHGITVDNLNKMLQVFPTDGYAKLIEGFKSNIAAGLPAHHVARYKVAANPYQAIEGDWEVEVLWVLHHEHSKWEEQLPQDTKRVLSASRNISGWQKTLRAQVTDIFNTGLTGVAREDLKQYPYISSGDVNLSPALTGLLTQQATWQMMQLQEQLGQLAKHAQASSSSGVGTDMYKGGLRALLLLPLLLVGVFVL